MAQAAFGKVEIPRPAQRLEIQMDTTNDTNSNNKTRKIMIVIIKRIQHEKVIFTIMVFMIAITMLMVKEQ